MSKNKICLNIWDWSSTWGSLKGQGWHFRPASQRFHLELFLISLNIYIYINVNYTGLIGKPNALSLPKGTEDDLRSRLI